MGRIDPMQMAQWGSNPKGVLWGWVEKCYKSII